MQLTDNDHVVTSLQVTFDASAGAVRDGVEEGGGYRLGFRLSTKPGRTLTIPLTYTYLGGATAADFTGLPANVTFGENATAAGVTIRPVDDFEEDPGESLKVSFGTLPAGVSVSSLSGRSTIIPVIDDDAPPGLSVADASAEEWPNTKVCLIFVVTMDRMDVDHEVSGDYATVSGTAVAGQDFTPISGTLVFRPSESRHRTASKSLCVEVIDDDHDEDTETMTLVLSNPVRAYLADGTATGSISNTDPMPRALMARFGRATAVEVVEQVEARLEARRERGFEARFARPATAVGDGARPRARFPQPAWHGHRRASAGRKGRPAGIRRRRHPDGPRGRPGLAWTAPDELPKRRRADRLGVRVEPADAPGRCLLVVGPGSAVAVRRPGGRAVSQRSGPHHHVGSRLRQGVAGDGPAAVPQQ